MLEIINNTGGKFFTVTFVKKDGTIRTMTARTGVRKGTNGNGLKFNPSERNLKVVWSCDAESFRMINLNTILGIKFKGKNYFNTVI
jgi:hypothetical protein